MDYAKWHFYLILLNSFLSLLAVIYSWWSTREKVIKSRYAHLTTEIEAMKSDIKLVKERDLPAHCSGHNEIKSQLGQHSTQLGQHKDLLTAIEIDLKHLPKNADLGKLHEKINTANSQLGDLKAEVNKIAGAMPGVTHLTEMMNEFLLNHGGKR